MHELDCQERDRKEYQKHTDKAHQSKVSGPAALPQNIHSQDDNNRLKPTGCLIINFLRSYTLSTYLHLSFREISFQKKKKAT